MHIKRPVKLISAITMIGVVIAVFSVLIFWRNSQSIEREDNKGAQETERRLKVRRAAVAGMFYESNPRRLEEEIQRYLNEATPTKIEGEVISLISPHAGYTYSGQAAAFGYKLLDKDKTKRAIILAPTHRVGFRGVSIADVGSYETPLGLVTLDREACDRLLKGNLFTSIAEVHSSEHSLEVQLPFLQVVLGDDFQLIPLVVGQLRYADYQEIAKALKSIIKRGDVVIASSDFTHQGPRFGYVPYRTEVKENIRKLDMGAVDLILKKDTRKFIDYVEETGATICGRCPIGILLELLPGDATGTLLTYYTSGDITGDERDTVSYVSLAFGSPTGWPGSK
jgi:AmmeMemoRadiSam system protein B